VRDANENRAKKSWQRRPGSNEKVVMAEIIACPSCQKKLQVPESFFGQTVQCPECRSTFLAQPPAGGAVSNVPPPLPNPAATIPPPPPLPAAPLPSAPPTSPPPVSDKPAAWDKPNSAPRRNKWGDEEEEEEKERRRKRKRHIDDDDEDEDDRPRRRRYREPVMPHRGGAILVLGIIGFLFCFPGLILGPLAWSMGTSDLESMRSGRMDPDGEGITQAGRILGIISTLASVALIGLACLGIALENNR
jgi:hypothetical protein